MQEAEAKGIRTGRRAWNARLTEARAAANRTYWIRSASVLKMHIGDLWIHA